MAGGGLLLSTNVFRSPDLGVIFAGETVGGDPAADAGVLFLEYKAEIGNG